ncbi:hypothetical protein LCGC14_0517040 [marine sediment metagenome]|uniref:DNA (cytosine-5-)-methyltransferase n=1 Tax=marine sediment metagenome TaxID=412755 RepID=A0A0F9RZP1_9ZZZZ
MQKEFFNGDKVILDLCGGTGSWSHPYSGAGYDVKVITLPELDVRTYTPPVEVYGILAAPPCTEFSMARNRYPEIPRNYVGGMEVVNACMRIILQCKPVFWALENPIGHLSKFLGKHNYRFEPWWFDEPWSKRTALWGKFNVPLRRYMSYKDNPKALTIDDVKAKRRFTARKDGIPSIADITSGNEKEKRAITPSGFARAFFTANP